MAEGEGELKGVLMKLKEESTKTVLKVNIQKMPSIYGKQKGKKWKQWQIFFTWAPKSLWTVTAVIKLKDTYSFWEKLW